jgi:hypothetical protein
LFVQGRSADFDFYIYRDAYTTMAGECPANQYGTTPTLGRTGPNTLDNIHNGDWALYAGVEFGNTEYIKEPDSLIITASCASPGGVVQVWLDSLDTGTKIAECAVSSTGSWTTFATFSAKVLTSVSGNHDVYLKFKGTGTDKLYMVHSLLFKDKYRPETSVRDSRYGQLPNRFDLEQNYPNPFNPTTHIRYSVPGRGYVSLKVYDLLGREMATLVRSVQPAGDHVAMFDGRELASGVYLFRLSYGNFIETKKMILLQ